jgi:hypothetical protein
VARNSSRAATITKFVSYVTGFNAEAQQLKNPFVSIDETK